MLFLIVFCSAAFSQIFELTPAIPSKPTVNLSGNQAVVSWQAVPNANRYYLLPIQNGFPLPEVIAGSPYSYSVAAGQSYQFKVRACNGQYDQPGPGGPISAAKSTVDSKNTTQNSSEICSDWSVASDAVGGQSVQPWAQTGGLFSHIANGALSSLQADETTGAIHAVASVSCGATVYSVPIVIPPGRNSMQPSISLEYSSRSGAGMAGVGWSVQAGSAISRCSATVAHDGYSKAVTMIASDKLCLDGQKLMAVSGSYVQSGTIYRTGQDQFVIYRTIIE